MKELRLLSLVALEAGGRGDLRTHSRLPCSVLVTRVGGLGREGTDENLGALHLSRCCEGSSCQECEDVEELHVGASICV